MRVALAVTLTALPARRSALRCDSVTPRTPTRSPTAVRCSCGSRPSRASYCGVLYCSLYCTSYDYDDWGSRIVQVGKLRLPGLAQPLCVG